METPTHPIHQNLSSRNARTCLFYSVIASARRHSIDIF